MNDAGIAEAQDAGDEGSAQTLEDLMGADAEPGVSEQAEAGAETEETEETEEPEADEAEETEDEKEDLGLTDEERKLLKQATTEKLERKIGKAHAKRKEAEERAESLEGERNALAERVTELERNLDAVDVNAASKAAGVSDLFLVETEAELVERQQGLEYGVDALQDWLDSHERDDEMVAANGTEYAWADVKARQRELQRTLSRDLPKARGMLERRAQATASARKLYPDLFKATSAAAQEMQQMLRTVPGLRAHPEYRLLVGRLLAGQALEKGAAASKPAARKSAPKPTAPKPPDNAAPPSRRAAQESMKHDPKKVAESGEWDDLV